MTRGTHPGRVHIGIGGWTYAPWRGTFYPAGLAQAKELAYAAQHLTSIEINSTYYGSQKPASFRQWAAAVPDGFVFSVKGPRFATNRRVLAEAGDSIARFFASGVLELGTHLGPILWQFAPAKQFDAGDFGKFLELLPRELDGRRLRHAVEVQHDSFHDRAFVALLRRFDIAAVLVDHAARAAIADLSADFVYVRLQRGRDDIDTGYPPAALGRWAEHAREWARGIEPDGLPRVEPDGGAPARPRDVFMYVINEGKLRAPAAAMALIARVADGR